jgi:arylsulfatase A-like enzyme
MRDELPTIVLVVFDTARWDRFGCYGYGRPTTPTVDRLAEQGLLAETMIANGPWTLPSHGSLFTGLYPSQHGSQWQTGPRLRDSVSITMPEWLRGLGYHTICATNNGLISDKTGLSRGFDRYAFRLDLERGRRRTVRRLRKVLAGGDSGGLIVNRWIREELRRAPRPTFLFVNYLECHWAYVPPRRLEKRVGGPRFGLLEGMRYRAGLARSAGPWEAIARADERTLDVYGTLYDGELANADEHLAELMGILRETGHVGDRPSLVMVTSDHGEHIGEHRLADHHASLDDHLIRVPFVAWGPGVIDRGRRSDLFELVDVFPSVARVLGRDVSDLGVAGRRDDLLSAVPSSNGERYAFAEWRSWTEKELARLSQRNASYDFAGLGRDLVCVRDDRFKLVRGSDGSEQLFEVNGGSGESVDVAAERPRDVVRLRARLDDARRTWLEWDDAGEPEVSEAEQAEIEQRLEELGYI